MEIGGNITEHWPRRGHELDCDRQWSTATQRHRQIAAQKGKRKVGLLL